MRRIVFLSALLLAACSQSNSGGESHFGGEPQSQVIEHTTRAANTRGSLSPSAPINLTYQVEKTIAGQSQRIDMTISTRLSSGTLLLEVAKQEGAEIIGDPTRRIDLAMAARPITLHMQAIQLGEGEHFLVLLLTIETEMGPMSRSFRIDLVAPSE